MIYNRRRLCSAAFLMVYKSSFGLKDAARMLLYKMVHRDHAIPRGSPYHVETD